MRSKPVSCIVILLICAVCTNPLAAESGSPYPLHDYTGLMVTELAAQPGLGLEQHWLQFKAKHLDPATRKWSGELENAGRLTKEALEKAQFGTDKIVRVLQGSKDFPATLHNPREKITGANLQLQLQRSYLQKLVRNLMSAPIALEQDVSKSYFQLKNTSLVFDETRNIVLARFTDGYVGFKGFIKAGVKVKNATIQFAPKIVKKGQSLVLQLNARLSYIDLANHSELMDKLFASLVEELLMTKGPILETDLSSQLKVQRSIQLFGNTRQIQLLPQQVTVNVGSNQLNIAARL